jgi:hypothetical protein
MPEDIKKEQSKKKSTRNSQQRQTAKQENRSEESENNIFPIVFTNQNLMQAVIYSEVLGKPRCKRRGRWR